MNNGFESLKDILDVIIVPVSLALIALAWPWFLSFYRRHQFITLICRELEELKPYNTSVADKQWTHYQPKNFIHQKIFLDPSSNIDFILTLPADLVYNISQLWFAREEGNLKQWENFLDKISLSEYGQGDRFQKAYKGWKTLISNIDSQNLIEQSTPLSMQDNLSPKELSD